MRKKYGILIFIPLTFSGITTGKSETQMTPVVDSNNVKKVEVVDIDKLNDKSLKLNEAMKLLKLQIDNDKKIN